jgi:hypothetical protein
MVTLILWLLSWHSPVAILDDEALHAPVSILD